jgi:hypothetical protein
MNLYIFIQLKEDNFMNQQPLNLIKPKSIHIEVTENGILISNVRIPYFIVQKGLKLGQIINNKRSDKNELDRLKDVDIDVILEYLNNGEISLPCRLIEVDEPDKNEHIKITLE